MKSKRVSHLYVISDISHHQLIPVEQLVIEEGHVSLVSWHADQVRRFTLQVLPPHIHCRHIDMCYKNRQITLSYNRFTSYAETWWHVAALLYLHTYGASWFIILYIS